jgi:phosphatidylglycerol:prolipoprotein diacylglycerol transferase
MSIAFLILGLLLALAGVGYLIYFLRSFITNPTVSEFSKKQLLLYFLLHGAIAAGFTFLMLALFLAHPEWKSLTAYADHLFSGESINYSYQISFALIGTFFFILTFALLWSSFALHYYKTKLSAEQKLLFARLMWGDIPLALAFFLVGSEGLAPYLSYPLINGFSITGTGWIWTTSADIASYKPLHIAFYGIIMLFGVCVSYWVCDHKFYQEFHKHGLLDTLVLIVFPAGVIGARIWYVVGNWNREFAGQNFGNVFRIWDGGITILGGAFAGALAGILFLHYRRKYINLRWAMDICLPTVLLAQAIGRWGNFFNSEVYGFTVNYHDGWSWLPRWILLQMNTNNSGGYLGANMIHVPLFLVESLLNIGGYFLLVYGIGKGLKKYLVPGDLGGGYFLWYGIVRLIMEPMRDSAFNMGTDNAWSICNSIVYIVIGVGAILFFHLHDYLKKKEGSSWPYALASIFAFAGLAFPAMMSLTASSGSGTSVAFLQGYQGFDILFSGKSPALLVAYIFAILSGVSYLLSLILHRFSLKKGERYLLFAGMGTGLVSALMFLLGAGWTSLPKSDGSTTINYSNSYGFVLLSLCLLLAFSMGLCLLSVEKEKAKAQKQEALNGEANETTSANKV